MKKIFFFALLLANFQNTFPNQTQFKQAWHQAQNKYETLCQNLEQNGSIDKRYVHPYWFECKEKIRRIILNPPNSKVLREAVIAHTMVRTGFAKAQRFEELSLKHCLSDSTKELIAHFKEVDFPFLPRSCKSFDCWTNSLGHLFYAAKIFEAFGTSKKIETIVELGGGYGSLARIFKLLQPQSTVVIFDLPEVMALQFFFLTFSLPETKIYIHEKPPQQKLESGTIHLIPTFFLDDMEIDADIFVSTFAISESPKFVQERVVQKKFFDAQVCYIVGQLDGWAGKYELHNFILSSVRSLYPITQCQPFHIQFNKLQNYEITGIFTK